MIPISKPSPALASLFVNPQNITNLQEWIRLVTAPFDSKGFAVNCFHLSSVLNKGTEELLPDERTDLVRVDFPMTISGLYFKTDADYDDEGSLILSVNNCARVSFLTSNHSIQKYRDMFGDSTEGLKGSYEEIVRFYLEYMSALMTIPKPEL